MRRKGSWSIFFSFSVHSERGGHAERCRGHAFLCVRSKRTDASEETMEGFPFSQGAIVNEVAMLKRAWTCFMDIQMNETDVLGEHVEDCDGFVGVHPEHKFKIVQVLRKSE